MIERHLADFILLLFRGSYESNESEETSTNDKSIIPINKNDNSECYFSEDVYVELESKKNKYQNNEFYSRCKKVNDNMWASVEKTMYIRGEYFVFWVTYERRRT